jgi:hypothetical protein
VTGFTIEGEIVLNVFDKLTSDKVLPVVEAVNLWLRRLEPHTKTRLFHR